MLLPLWRGLLPRARHLSWNVVGLTVLTGGLPFGLLISGGAQWAPASHVAVFTNGMVPILAAFLAWVSTRERIGARRAVGFLLVLAGAAILAACGQAGIEGSWRGDLLFVAAAFCWAIHTHAYRRSGLTPWEGAALVSSGSAIALFVLLLFTGTGPLMLFTAPWREVLLQILWQTVLGGLLAAVAYLAAVRQLGGARAALWAALVPALTVGGEVLFLSQPPQVNSMLAAALVAAGVLAGNLEARVSRG
jgi:drug/metabolite transporter (DMT)-like permease